MQWGYVNLANNSFSGWMQVSSATTGNLCNNGEIILTEVDANGNIEYSAYTTAWGSFCTILPAVLDGQPLTVTKWDEDEVLINTESDKWVSGQTRRVENVFGKIRT